MQAMNKIGIVRQRLDPYKNFKFRIKWDGRYVAGMSRVSELRPATKLKPIVLERGMTQDPSFLSWANEVGSTGERLGLRMAFRDLRTDLRIESMNEAGRLVAAWDVLHCRPAEFTASPELDAIANAVSIEHLKLDHEGWVRDTSLVDPT
jgi:phage tail-like protein